MILGNHCTYYKNTNKINSPELLLENYENITIYSSPEHNYRWQEFSYDALD